MQGIEKIIAKIISDAELDAKATAEQTKAQIEELQNKCDLRTKEAIDKINKEADEKAVQYKSRAETMADLESRRNNLATKRELVELAFYDAVNKIKSLDDATYLDFMKKLLVSLEEKNGELIVSKNDTRITQSLIDDAKLQLNKKGITCDITMSTQKGDFDGGFILKRGRIEINCTLDMLVKSAKRELEQEVAGVLFTESGE
jgi:V/A-type H+-transporting ATPase subunit E